MALTTRSLLATFDVDRGTLQEAHLLLGDTYRNGQSGLSRPAPRKGNRAMSRIHRALTLTLLLALLALPASAVTSSRTNGNGTGSFLSVLWSTLTSFFSGETTDGRCALDPGGICLPDHG